MTLGLNTDGNVSLCYKDNCVNFKGVKANLVVGVAIVMLVIAGIAALSEKQ